MFCTIKFNVILVITFYIIVVIIIIITIVTIIIIIIIIIIITIQSPNSFIDNKANYKIPFTINFTNKLFSQRTISNSFRLKKRDT